MIERTAADTTFSFLDCDNRRCKLPSVMKKRSTYLELLINKARPMRLIRIAHIAERSQCTFLPRPHAPGHGYFSTGER